MLTGDGGTILILGATAGRITSWEMRPGPGGVTVAVTGAISPLFAGAGATEATVRLRRSANPAYDVTLTGAVGEISPTRLVVHRCEERAP